jgi:hypothetical protein
MSYLGVFWMAAASDYHPYRVFWIAAASDYHPYRARNFSNDYKEITVLLFIKKVMLTFLG